ncbi:TPA: hypothetical protein EYP66_18865 [Candidatus Poribacteria bacterium]|nr:hypothetical protein [Candidatus Poribacteria bacterium]
MIPNEVFLSHSSLARDFVTHLANVLRHHGVPVWYSQTNIMGAWTFFVHHSVADDELEYAIRNFKDNVKGV